MKTIFITMSDGEVSKSILQSAIFPLLKEKAHLVLFVSKNTHPYFSQTYAAENVSVEILPAFRFAWVEEAFADVFLYSLHTPSILVKIRHAAAAGGSPIGKWIKLLLWYLGQFRIYRAKFRLLYRLLPDRSYDAFFEKYHPEVVFAANLTSSEDARLLKAARRYGVQSVGMPKGWDNLTLKTFLPVFPDQLLVQTKEMRSDAVFLGYPTNRISVTGFPKFDLYADLSLILPREEFMKKLGLDPMRKLILYSGAGGQLAPHDEDILADLITAIADNKIEGMPCVLVRPHPKYPYRTDALPPHSFWVLDRPGKIISAKASDFEFDRDDVIHLMNSLYHADLLIHTASTLGVEAAIFDKPSITLAYDGHATVSSALSTARYYDYVHMRRVLLTGGMKVAHSLSELVRSTNEYLQDPTIDRAGRDVIVAGNAAPIDGGAGKRVAEAVIQLLSPSRNS